jgi:hypothetical protein
MVDANDIYARVKLKVYALVCAVAMLGWSPAAFAATGAMLRVRVLEVGGDKVIRPLAGQAVTVVALEGGGGPHAVSGTLLGQWHARTDATGMALVAGVTPPPNAVLRVVAPYQGVTYRSQENITLPRFKPVELRVFPVRVPPGDVGLRCAWLIEVGESHLLVTQEVVVENPSAVTIDYVNSSHGLRIPTLSYLLGDNQILTHGVFPPGALHSRVMPSTGQGRVFSENGAVVYRGPVLPGTDLSFRFSYAVPFSSESARFGTVSDVDVRFAQVVVAWSRRAFPRVQLERAHRATTRQTETSVRVNMTVEGTLRGGEALVLRFDNLPVQTAVPRWIAGVGGALAIGLLVLLVITAWLRRRWSTA